jgi:D-xylonolactonase
MALNTIEAEHFLSLGCTLGEGPNWSARDAALWFVDIKAPCVYRLDPATRKLDRWAAPAHIGWVLPLDDGGWLAGLSTGLHRFDPADGSFTPVAEIEAHLPDNRLNDAAVAPDGRIWFGSMDNLEADATGHVYHWHRGDVAKADVAPIVITNGPAISPDGKTLYLVDTLGLAIDAHAIDATGNVGPAERFLTIDPAHGHPDGAICDADGGVWVGFFGGWAARRFAPDGTQTDEVRFPVANITKIAIGGADGRTAFATTARQGLSADQLAAQPLAGDIFTFPVAIPGLPTRLATTA